MKFFDFSHNIYLYKQLLTLPTHPFTMLNVFELDKAFDTDTKREEEGRN